MYNPYACEILINFDKKIKLINKYNQYYFIHWESKTINIFFSFYTEYLTDL